MKNSQSHPFQISGRFLSLAGRGDGSFRPGSEDGFFWEGRKVLDSFSFSLSIGGKRLVPGSGELLLEQGCFAEYRFNLPRPGLRIFRQLFIPPDWPALLLEYHFQNIREEEEGMDLGISFSARGLRGKAISDKAAGLLCAPLDEGGFLLLKPSGRLKSLRGGKVPSFRMDLYLSPFGQKVLHLYLALGKTREEAEKVRQLLAERHPEEFRKTVCPEPRGRI